MNIQVILGSTRPGRNGAAVAEWVTEIVKEREDVDVELVDVADFNLPILDEPMPAASGQYSMEHTKKWSAKIAGADAYIFVTPEYNHGVPGSFKNAVDYLYSEWNNKTVGFVGYGVEGASRAVESWRQIVSQLKMADINSQVGLNLGEDFEEYAKFKPMDNRADQLNKLVDELVLWGGAMNTIR